MSDDQELGEGQENASQENNKNVVADELAALRDKIDLLTANQFQQQQQSQAPQVQRPALTEAEAAALAANPALMANWIQSQADNAVNGIKKESQKQFEDAQAYAKFPLLNTDKEFQKRVTQQMREMIAGGEYSKDSPKLLFRASQIVAAEYAPSRSSAKNQNASSIESRQSGAQSNRPSSQKVDDNDPQIQFGRLLGLEGAKLEKFRSQLKPFVAPQRRATRRFSK